MCVGDPLSSSMATYRWKNASSPAVHDYAALYHLKHWLATDIDAAISVWCASKKKENPGVVPEYKVGVEVKALFKKNHIDLLTLALRLKHWKRRGCCSSTKCLRKPSAVSLHQMTEMT